MIRRPRHPRQSICSSTSRLSSLSPVKTDELPAPSLHLNIHIHTFISAYSLRVITMVQCDVGISRRGTARRRLKEKPRNDGVGRMGSIIQSIAPPINLASTNPFCFNLSRDRIQPHPGILKFYTTLMHEFVAIRSCVLYPLKGVNLKQQGSSFHHVY